MCLFEILNIIIGLGSSWWIYKLYNEKKKRKNEFKYYLKDDICPNCKKSLQEEPIYNVFLRYGKSIRKDHCWNCNYSFRKILDKYYIMEDKTYVWKRKKLKCVNCGKLFKNRLDEIYACKYCKDLKNEIIKNGHVYYKRRFRKIKGCEAK